MTYTPPIKPYKHQLAALAKMEGMEAFALRMRQRTGKTKTLLDDFGRLELDKQCNRLLAVAPGGVYRTWEGACKEHLSADLQSRATVFTWQSSGGKSWTRALDHFLAQDDPARPRIFLVNVEALSSVKRAREAVKLFLGKGEKAMATGDESTMWKGNTDRTKFAVQEIKPRTDFRRIMSGLDTPKSPLDLFYQFEFLDPKILGFRSWYSFRNRYAVMKPQWFGGRQIQQIIGFRDLEELYAKIEPYSFRVRLEDCYDLPPKVYKIREVSLTPEQEKAYKEIKEYATTMLSGGQHVTATIVIAQIIRLHQILCGFAKDEQGNVHELSERRTREVVEILEDYDGKAIIWCAYRNSVERVAAALQKAFGENSVAKFYGGNKPTREQEERRFLDDPSCYYMVATAAAGGRGRTWSNASLMIYHSRTADLEHSDQSEERTQAVGKTESTLYIDLMSPGTVEEKFLQLLRKKIDMATVINGDNYREWLI